MFKIDLFIKVGHFYGKKSIKLLYPNSIVFYKTQWARNGFEFFEEQRQKPIEGKKLGQKLYGKKGSSKS